MNIKPVAVAAAAIQFAVLAGCSNNDEPEIDGAPTQVTRDEAGSDATVAPQTRDTLTATQQTVFDVVPFLPMDLGPEFPETLLIGEPVDCETDPAIYPLSCALPDVTFAGPDGNPAEAVVIVNVEDGFAALAQDPDGRVWCAAARGVGSAYGSGSSVPEAVEDCVHPSW